MLIPPGFVDEDDIMAEELSHKDTVNLEEQDICLEGISFIISDAPGAMGDMVAVDDNHDDVMDVATAVVEEGEAVAVDVDDANVRDGDTVQVLKMETSK